MERWIEGEPGSNISLAIDLPYIAAVGSHIESWGCDVPPIRGEIEACEICRGRFRGEAEFLSGSITPHKLRSGLNCGRAIDNQPSGCPDPGLPIISNQEIVGNADWFR